MISSANVLVAGGVVVKGLISIGSVIIAGGVVEEGITSIGSVLVAGGVVEKSLISIGSVIIAGGVVIELATGSKSGGDARYFIAGTVIGCATSAAAKQPIPSSG